MTVVIGTAGHIDHGKTTLLRALTGIDADRLPEERRRGVTIDVGYAHLALPDGTELDFVDVPGHDRLVGNMLVGAGEIDAALVVVAADDGPRAQTIEHLELLDALDIRHGIAVVTKCDLAGGARTAAVVQEVGELIGRSTLAGSPVVAVCSTSGEGIDTLRSALLELRDRVLADPARRRPSSVRMAIDRAFSVKGRGSVVTGSLRGGRLERGAVLRLEPGGRPARAREVQVHGGSVEAVEDGGRVALNLAGIDDEALARGAVLTTDPAVRASNRLLAILRRPAQLDDRARTRAWPPPAGSTFRLHLGTESVDARIRRGRRDSAGLPDGRRVVTLGLARPIAVAPGDSFVLRVPSPAATAAGGQVLDPTPPVGASARRLSADDLTAFALARLNGDEGAELAARLRIHGLVARPDGPPPAHEAHEARGLGAWLLAGEVASALEAEGLALVEAHRVAAPLAKGAPLAEIRRTLARALRRRVSADERHATELADALIGGMVGDGRLVRDGDLVRDPNRSSGTLPPAALVAMDRLEAALNVPAPPALAEAVRASRCPAEGVRALEAAGRIVRVEDDLAWAGATYRELEALALRLADPGPLTPAALRDATGTSRKYVMALLEDLARRGVLRRTPDGHVRGPRAPR
ncbi:MAG: selenocysteine-specific translation elongation factor [Chloroflexota bacterium]|nr:selenocysteine-specific translation elongation factor [Chloroflexota bacterium]